MLNASVVGITNLRKNPKTHYLAFPPSGPTHLLCARFFFYVFDWSTLDIGRKMTITHILLWSNPSIHPSIHVFIGSLKCSQFGGFCWESLQWLVSGNIFPSSASTKTTKQDGNPLATTTTLKANRKHWNFQTNQPSLPVSFEVFLRQIKYRKNCNLSAIW